jgi:hypothetical protein
MASGIMTKKTTAAPMRNRIGVAMRYGMNAALVLVEAGRDEPVDLGGDHREGDEERAEQRELQLGDEEFLRRGVDQPDVAADPAAHS